MYVSALKEMRRTIGIAGRPRALFSDPPAAAATRKRPENTGVSTHERKKKTIGEKRPRKDWESSSELNKKQWNQILIT